jgi:hypothetical protein
MTEYSARLATALFSARGRSGFQQGKFVGEELLVALQKKRATEGSWPRVSKDFDEFYVFYVFYVFYAAQRLSGAFESFLAFWKKAGGAWRRFCGLWLFGSASGQVGFLGGLQKVVEV